MIRQTLCCEVLITFEKIVEEEIIHFWKEPVKEIRKALKQGLEKIKKIIESNRGNNFFVIGGLYGGETWWVGESYIVGILLFSLRGVIFSSLHSSQGKSAYS